MTTNPSLESTVPRIVNIEDYFKPVQSDADIRHALVHRHRYTGDKAMRVVDAYHRLFHEVDSAWDGPICIESIAGFSLKEHASLAGPCYQNFVYLRNWTLKNDEATKSAHVFFIPRLLDKSTSKNVDEQKVLMDGTRKKYDLPEHHFVSFGSAALLTGLVLSHFKRTNLRMSPNSNWGRSDTFHMNGRRLNISSFDTYGLDCNYWGWDDCRYSNLGAFPLGVEIG